MGGPQIPQMTQNEFMKRRINAAPPKSERIFAAGIQVNAEDGTLPDVIQLAPFGEWPTRDKSAVQVFNAEAAEQVIGWFNFWPRRIARWARVNAIKVYVGHPDFAPSEWPERIELGSIVELSADEHGLNAKVQWNAEAMQHVSKHKWPSVAWDCEINGDGTETPTMLWSVGMWHKPNIRAVRAVINADGEYEDSEPDTGEKTKPETNMLNKIMEALRAAGVVKDGDNEDTVMGAIGSMISSLAWKREEETRQKAMAAQMRTALNAAAEVEDAALPDEAVARINAQATEIGTLTERLNALTTERDDLRAARINAAVERLIETGRVTKADEDTVRGELNADFDAALSKRLATSVQLNSAPLKIGGHKPAITEARERMTRINAWCEAYMAQHGSTWDDAWRASKSDPVIKALHEQAARADAAREQEG